MKAIIFDCFGVLTTDYWREFVAKLPADIRPAAADLNKAYDGGFIAATEFMDQVEALTGQRPDTVEHRKGQAKKNHELLDYIAQLKPHYKIGLLSNIASDWITDEFLTPAEQSLFHAMIFSHAVYLTKPDHRIFELMAERLAVEPSDCVMVDDIEANCTGARETGMQAVEYHDFAQAQGELDRLLS